MHSLVAVVPLLILAGILTMIAAPMLRNRLPRVAAKRPAAPVRKPRETKLTLHVTPSQMDDELKDLIRRS